MMPGNLLQMTSAKPRNSALKPDYLTMKSGKDRSAPERTLAKHIYFWVLLCGFIIQLVLQSVTFELVDHSMWANQIQYFLTNDPRLFDFSAAYGHPGTTLVELGSLFHVLFGFSYSTALTLSMSILIAMATAACSVLCFLLYPQTLWWLASTCILLLNRMYINATPPTTVAMPFTVLIVLATWWLWENSVSTSRWLYFLWGAVVGLAAATRLDAALLVGTPMFVLLWYRHGGKVVLPILTGAGISFFVSDPFLWFMPIQHITDLAHKFTKHYSKFDSTMYSATIEPADMVNAVWLSAVSFGWAFVLLCYRRLARIIPVPIMVIFSGTSVMALLIILSSKFQAVRYLFPLTIIWEVFLPLFALETLEPSTQTTSSKALFQNSALSLWIIVLVVLTQLLAYTVIFIHL